jgi:hypothetical protein
LVPPLARTAPTVAVVVRVGVDLVVDVAGIASRALHELAVAAGIGSVPVLRLGSSGGQCDGRNAE